jgi:hypothetical protein
MAAFFLECGLYASHRPQRSCPIFSPIVQGIRGDPAPGRGRAASPK